ncbi:hypothetical protein Nepgr_029667 [Nepenthes gracilis]|uniref:Uncharacterized protein n=1 Tax=Nepenthes gracilis TaxID=150966 RepID=A0AAD3Y5B0_NEPGR|nr:hypothetical protein Nepgr_029667 [Nepenthes gracilis]
MDERMRGIGSSLGGWPLPCLPQSSMSWRMVSMQAMSPCPPARASRELEAEEPIEQVFTPTSVQHGVLFVTRALFEELVSGPSAALVEVTPDDM